VLDSFAAPTWQADAAWRKVSRLRDTAARGAQNRAAGARDDASALDRFFRPHPGGAKTAV
jgi:hypothetical protein